MTASTATLLRHEPLPAVGREARPPAAPRAAPDGPGGARAEAPETIRRPGTLKLVITGRASPEAPRAESPAAQPGRPPAPEAVRVTALRAVLDVAGAGDRRRAGRLLSRRAPDRDLGLRVRQALAASSLGGSEAGSRTRPHNLIHPDRAFCDGHWTRPRRPAQLLRIAGRGPLPDRTRTVSFQRLGEPREGVVLLTPRSRRGPAGLALLALRAAAPDEALGAAVREALALSR